MCSKEYEQIEELTPSFQSQFEKWGTNWFGKTDPKKRSRARKEAQEPIACPPSAPSVTGLSDSLMRFKMTGMRTPCCGKGSYSWY